MSMIQKKHAAGLGISTHWRIQMSEECFLRRLILSGASSCTN